MQWKGLKGKLKSIYKIFWCLVLQYNMVYTSIDHLLESSRAVSLKKNEFSLLSDNEQLPEWSCDPEV